MKPMLLALMCSGVLLLFAGTLLGQEEKTTAEDLKDEMARMREELKRTKEAYEKRLQELQKRIEELEAKPRLKPEEAEKAERLKRVEKQVEMFLKEAREKEAEAELEELRRAARVGAVEEKPAEKPEETVFKSGSLGLQALNPEISVAGDMMYRFVQSKDEPYADHWIDQEVERSRFLFRVLDIHIESYLDPYSRFKAAIPVTEDFSRLGEAYMTRYGVLPGVNFTVGKFRQQFGVVNRWHRHALDQVDFPMPLMEIFGPGGLNQTGVSVDWTMPEMFGSSQELTVQVTNSRNRRLFAGDFMSWPATLFHYKNYRDLNKDTYVELGFSGLAGTNSRCAWRDELGNLHDDHGTRWTTVWGSDLTVFWEPTEKMRYRNLLWRSEFYYVNKHVLLPDASGQDQVEAYGFYSYLQAKIARTLDIGCRLDFYFPDTKDYVEPHLAFVQKNPFRWQVSPYITWQQSPWVKFRLEYDHVDGMHVGPPEDRVFLQCVFAAGPHKHERY